MGPPLMILLQAPLLLDPSLISGYQPATYKTPGVHKEIFEGSVRFCWAYVR